MGVGSIFSRFWYGTLKILFVKTTCTCTLRLIEHMYWCQKPVHEFFRVFSIGFKTPQIEFFARTPFWRYKIWNEFLLSKRCSPVASDTFRWSNGAWRAFLNFFGFFRRVLSLFRWVFRANPVKRQIFRTEKNSCWAQFWVYEKTESCVTLRKKWCLFRPRSFLTRHGRRRPTRELTSPTS